MILLSSLWTLDQRATRLRRLKLAQETRIEKHSNELDSSSSSINLTRQGTTLENKTEDIWPHILLITMASLCLINHIAIEESFKEIKEETICIVEILETVHPFQTKEENTVGHQETIHDDSATFVERMAILLLIAGTGSIKDINLLLTFIHASHDDSTIECFWSKLVSGFRGNKSCFTWS